MPDVELRKIATVIEEVFHEGGPRANTPQRRAAVIAVIKNPYAGQYVENIQPFMEDLKPLGLQMAQKLIDALGGDASVIEGYGKGSIVGTSRRTPAAPTFLVEGTIAFASPSNSRIA